MNKAIIQSLFNHWNEALQTYDPKKVVALYDRNAMLLPTLSNQVRHNHDEIEQYFIDFLANKASGTINESNIRIYNNIAINSGIYTFKFKDNTQATARFTFVYELKNEQWLIIEHHSSLMPE